MRRNACLKFPGNSPSRTTGTVCLCSSCRAFRTSHACTGSTLRQACRGCNRELRCGCAEAVEEEDSLWKAQEKAAETAGKNVFPNKPTLGQWRNFGFGGMRRALPSIKFALFLTQSDARFRHGKDFSADFLGTVSNTAKWRVPPSVRNIANLVTFFFDAKADDSGRHSIGGTLAVDGLLEVVAP